MDFPSLNCPFTLFVLSLNALHGKLNMQQDAGA